MSRPRALHALLVALLLPEEVRRRHGDAMTAVFEELHREAGRRGRGALMRLWARELAGLVRLAVAERGTSVSRPGAPPSGRLEEGGRTMGRNLRHGLRALAARPLATFAALATLALGIGAGTAVFSVVDGVLLHPLDFEEPSELALLYELDRDGDEWGLTYRTFRDLQAADGGVEELAAWVGNSVSVTGLGEPERIRGEFVSASYFPLFGVRPALGRWIEPGEDGPGGDRTVVLSWGWWQRRFGGDPGVLGRSVTLNDEPHTIVGVMPREFHSSWDETEAWISLHTMPRDLDASSHSLFAAFARLEEGVTMEQAAARLSDVLRAAAETRPEAEDGHTVTMMPLTSWVVGQDRARLLKALLGAVGLLLLMACANVANLQLVGASERAREMAVRAAMGGSRRDLLGQLLTESLLLSTAGGLLGVGVAALGVRGLLALDPRYAIFDVGVDLRVLGFALVVSLVVGIVFGIGPALQASRTDLGTALREGGRSASAGRRAGRLRGGLIVAQMGVAVVLLVSFGLLTRTMANFGRVDPGFDPDHLLTAEFRLTAERYEDDAQVVALLDAVLAHLARIPGVTGVAAADALPFSGNGGTVPFVREGEELDARTASRVAANTVSPDYFRVMGIPLLRGRGLTPDDVRGAPPVAVLSRTAVERHFAGEDPIGQRVLVEGVPAPITIVGVVGDVRLGLDQDVTPTAYASYRQLPSRFTSLALRTAVPPMELERALEETFWEAAPDQPIWEIMPITQRMEGSLRNERFLFSLLAVFAGAALLLAGIGIYGVIGFAVSRRKHELGIRVALGAGRRRILRMVLGQGLAMTLVGVALGLVGAAFATHLLGAALFGVQPLDPVAFAAAPVVLTTVAVLACWIPARRAVRVDPVEALGADG